LEPLKEEKINDPPIEYLNFEWGLRLLNSLQQLICKYLQHFLAKMLYQGRQPFELNEGTIFSGWPQQDILKFYSI
jgi:hypothetical protein